MSTTPTAAVIRRSSPKGCAFCVSATDATESTAAAEARHPARVPAREWMQVQLP
nr:hypothetical protein [Micromonospora sp. DSM 115978]